MPNVQARIGDAIVAESNNTVLIEGSHYFPPNSVDMSLLRDSEKHTTCHWKGEASYKTLVVNGERFEDLAWYYPNISDQAKKRVGVDFSGWFGFYTNRDLEIIED